MKHNDEQLGTPEIPYRNTKANIEALSSGSGCTNR